MKKILILIIAVFSLTGCLKNDSMEDISITTSVYPIQYIVDYLYGDYSEISSIYPNDSNINEFKITNVLLKDYSKNDLFIFNGLSEENKYVKTMKKNNNELKIIDSTANMTFEYSLEELWLDPNNLLTIANNIKNGFNEYIKANYLINKIDENYTNLKFELTSLDGKFYSTVKNSEYDYIIVDDDAFKFLEKYGLTVISLDKDTVKEKDIYTAKELLNDGDCSYIFTVYGNEKSDTVNEILTSTGKTNLELYTMTDLSELNIEKNNYITLMNDNLNQLKQELYK
jgi:zinc transport system substrate-binding protein